MINETGNTENTSFSDEAPATPTQSPKSVNSNPSFGLGKKSLGPLLNVLAKHKSDVSPYLDALTKALIAAAESLKGEEAPEAETFVAGYFSDGAAWLARWKDKLAGQSPDDILTFLEEEGQKHPAILFGTSYVAGLMLGRFGRHIGKSMKENINIH